MSNHRRITGERSCAQPKAPCLHLRGLTFDAREHVLSRLLEALDRAGGWVLERQASSTHGLTLWVEMQTRVLMDIYAAIAGSDVSLTRESHQVLSDRLNCVGNLQGTSALSAMVTLRLEIAFLAASRWNAGWIADETGRKSCA